jgi:hypothetical protein
MGGTSRHQHMLCGSSSALDRIDFLTLVDFTPIAMYGIYKLLSHM